MLPAARSQAPLAAIIINFGRARIIAHPDRSILGTFVQKGAKLVFLKLIASVRSIQCWPKKNRWLSRMNKTKSKHTHAENDFNKSSIEKQSLEEHSFGLPWAPWIGLHGQHREVVNILIPHFFFVLVFHSSSFFPYSAGLFIHETKSNRRSLPAVCWTALLVWAFKNECLTGSAECSRNQQ